MKKLLRLYLISISVIVTSMSSFRGLAQHEMIVDLSMIDGVEITPDNIFRFNVVSTYDRTVTAEVKGRIVYRQSMITLEYKFIYNIMPGLNTIDAGTILPQYTFSSTSLRELFQTYRKLPQGLFEYCVHVMPDVHNTEIEQLVFSQCLYQKSEDLFFITLVDPENDAKIYEYNPMLTWMVNYPFAQELKYKIRLAEVKKGQNPVAAMTRNNPIYEEGNLFNTGQMYPVYARPLVKDQKYVWTVDAYYKDLLLGGAEPFTFTIVEDSVSESIPAEVSYYDFSVKKNEARIFAIDTLKLKYSCRYPADSLVLDFYDKSGDQVANTSLGLSSREGLNYYDLDLIHTRKFRHKGHYYVVIKTNRGLEYRVPFTFIDNEKR
ncbi:MAG: hypothetical protein KL787_05625 [Taibaiella sp.]|nr:hypothetical protein [Taibaiella sp.]